MRDGIEAIRQLIREGMQNLCEVDWTLFKMKVDQLQPAEAAAIMEDIAILVEHRLNHLRSYQNKDLSAAEKEVLGNLIADYESKIEKLRYER